MVSDRQSAGTGIPGECMMSAETTTRWAKYVGFMAFAGSFGWIAEALWHLLKLRRVYIESAFKRFPFSPTYALGAGIALALARLLRGRRLWIKIPAYYLVVNGYEYLAGALVLKVTGKRVWDYTHRSRYNLHGHVDLPHSIRWLVISLLFDRALFPRIESVFWPQAQKTTSPSVHG